MVYRFIHGHAIVPLYTLSVHPHHQATFIQQSRCHHSKWATECYDRGVEQITRAYRYKSAEKIACTQAVLHMTM